MLTRTAKRPSDKDEQQRRKPVMAANIEQPRAVRPMNIGMPDVPLTNARPELAQVAQVMPARPVYTDDGYLNNNLNVPLTPARASIAAISGEPVRRPVYTDDGYLNNNLSIKPSPERIAAFTAPAPPSSDALDVHVPQRPRDAAGIPLDESPMEKHERLRLGFDALQKRGARKDHDSPFLNIIKGMGIRALQGFNSTGGDLKNRLAGALGGSIEGGIENGITGNMDEKMMFEKHLDEQRAGVDEAAKMVQQSQSLESAAYDNAIKAARPAADAADRKQKLAIEQAKIQSRFDLETQRQMNRTEMQRQKDEKEGKNWKPITQNGKVFKQYDDHQEPLINSATGEQEVDLLNMPIETTSENGAAGYAKFGEILSSDATKAYRQQMFEWGATKENAGIGADNAKTGQEYQAGVSERAAKIQGYEAEQRGLIDEQQRLQAAGDGIQEQIAQLGANTELSPDVRAAKIADLNKQLGDVENKFGAAKLKFTELEGKKNLPMPAPRALRPAINAPKAAAAARKTVPASKDPLGLFR